MSTFSDRLCPQCVTKLESDARVCPRCGYRLPMSSIVDSPQREQPPSSSSPGTPFASLDHSPQILLPVESASQNDVPSATTSVDISSSPGSSPRGTQATAVPHSRSGNHPYRSGCMTLLAVLVGIQAVSFLLIFLPFFTGGAFISSPVIGIPLLVGGAFFIIADMIIGLLLAATFIMLIWALWTVRLRRWLLWVGIAAETVYLALGVQTFWQTGRDLYMGVFLPLAVLIGLFASSTIRAVVRRH